MHKSAYGDGLYSSNCHFWFSSPHIMSAATIKWEKCIMILYPPPTNHFSLPQFATSIYSRSPVDAFHQKTFYIVYIVKKTSFFILFLLWELVHTWKCIIRRNKFCTQTPVFVCFIYTCTACTSFQAIAQNHCKTKLYTAIHHHKFLCANAYQKHVKKAQRCIFALLCFRWIAS